MWKVEGHVDRDVDIYVDRYVEGHVDRDVDIW